MCYGDIGHGSDHYYERWVEEQMRIEEELKEQERALDALTQEYLEKEILAAEAEIANRDLSELEKIAEMQRLKELEGKSGT